PLMFSIAYRMLGSVSEAEDVVQEALLRIYQSERDGVIVEKPEAFATTVTTRLAIDALRSARRRRERYTGEWLPEPLVESADSDPARRIEMDETVSIAFLTLMERLSPTERAVFLLREVFGYSFAEIAEVVSTSEANCRQLLHRARRRIEEAKHRFEPSTERTDALFRQFFTAISDGDLAGLERMLAEDAVFHADGGGKVPAIARPISGATGIARFLLGLDRHGKRFGMQLEFVRVNGQPAARYSAPNGLLLAIVTLDVADGQVYAVHNQINPDKLAHVGPVGDLNALLQAPRQV